MKIKLAFFDWQKNGKSIYGTEKGVELSIGDFHSGTTFDGTLELDAESEAELQRAFDAGCDPVFIIYEKKIKKDLTNGIGVV